MTVFLVNLVSLTSHRDGGGGQAWDEPANADHADGWCGSDDCPAYDADNIGQDEALLAANQVHQLT